MLHFRYGAPHQSEYCSQLARSPGSAPDPSPTADSQLESACLQQSTSTLFATHRRNSLANSLESFGGVSPDRGSRLALIYALRPCGQVTSASTSGRQNLPTSCFERPAPSGIRWQRCAREIRRIPTYAHVTHDRKSG